MRFDAEPKKINKYPSKAYRNAKGEFVPDPDNQPLAVAFAEGRCAAQPLEHGTHGVRPGYCAQHLRLGCMECK